MLRSKSCPSAARHRRIPADREGFRRSSSRTFGVRHYARVQAALPEHGTRRAIAQLPPPGGTPNPYAELLYAALEDCGLPRLPFPELTFAALWRARRTHAYLHFNWRPDRYYAPCLADQTRFLRRSRAAVQLVRFALLLRAARTLDYRIVWTAHEAYPARQGARGRRIDRLGQSLLARASSVLLAHDRATAEQLRAQVVGSRFAVEIVPHGAFAGAYPVGGPGVEIRRALGISTGAFVFLCFGQLRADKQVGLLLDAFARVRSPDVRLVIAGDPADTRSSELVVRAARADSRIKPLLEAVPHERVAELFAMADAFVLARGEVWSSGSLILALSLGLPVVAARLDSTHELLGGADAGWLFVAGDVDSLAETLEHAAASRVVAAVKGLQARRSAESLPSWREIALRMAALFTSERVGESRPSG